MKLKMTEATALSPRQVAAAVCSLGLVKGCSVSHAAAAAAAAAAVLLLLLLQFTEEYRPDGSESTARRRDFRKGEGAAQHSCIVRTCCMWHDTACTK
jgi:hypothetical protein